MIFIYLEDLGPITGYKLARLDPLLEAPSTQDSVQSYDFKFAGGTTRHSLGPVIRCKWVEGL